MVAKGHDLPAITVAGVLDADAALQHADFRAEERAFSLIVQLAGRAGRRRGEPARVIVQAWEPAARAVRLGAEHAVEVFLEGELTRREPRGFPPFGHLVRIVTEGDGPEAVRGSAAGIAADLIAAGPDLAVLGPAPLHRLRGRTRRAILLRAERASRAAGVVREVLALRGDADHRAGVRVTVDVDPQQT
jgi:primosomal protein N' (replication factor Y)